MKHLLAIGALLMVAGCAGASSSSSPSSPSSSALKDDQRKRIGMPNPASAYCIERGGRLELRETPDGDTGYCHLPDGRVVEEWALFREGPKDGGN